MAAVPNVGRATRVETRVAPEATTTQDLYERYSAQLLGFCFHKLGNREEAEDAVQQTFLNAFRGLKRGIVPEAESAWLFKIAENVCLTRRRSSFRRGRVESASDVQALQEYVAAPERMGTHDLIQLQKALLGMPASQRKAILLREWQGLSYREIADEMGLSQPAVETLIFRARRSLAEGLERPEERSSLLARLRNALDLASLAGALKALLAGTAAAKAVATTAVAVTAAGAVVVAAPEPGGQDAPRAGLQTAPDPLTAAAQRRVGDRTSAASADDAPRTARATERAAPSQGRATRPAASVAATTVEPAAVTPPEPAPAAVGTSQTAPPAQAEAAPPAPGQAQNEPAAPHADGSGKDKADSEVTDRRPETVPAAAASAVPEPAPQAPQANAGHARPAPAEPAAHAAAPELPAAAEAMRADEAEASAEKAEKHDAELESGAKDEA